MLERDEAWQRGPKSRKGRDGVHREVRDVEEGVGVIDQPGGVAGEYVCFHKRLRGRRRCLGCGKTRNEIELEGA